MKLGKIILTGVIATALTSGAFAQEAAVETTVAVTEIAPNAISDEANDNGTEIKLSELPVGVQNALKSDKYKAWISKRAWVVTRDDNKFYRVEVENPKGESTTLLFDGTGKVVD